MNGRFTKSKGPVKRIGSSAASGAAVGATAGLALGRRGPGVARAAAVGALGGAAAHMSAAKPHPNTRNAKTGVRATGTRTKKL